MKAEFDEETNILRLTAEIVGDLRDLSCLGSLLSYGKRRATVSLEESTMSQTRLDLVFERHKTTLKELLSDVGTVE